MSTTLSSRPPRGRLAPSPTGLVHLGNARTALIAWLSVRSRGGTLVYRLEDLDRSRVVPGLAEATIEDLRWLGLDWDEGGGQDGPFAPYEQSKRSAIYEAALDKLYDAQRLFPCARSRRDLEGIASAPHGDGATAAYPRALRPPAPARGWLAELRAARGDAAAVRFAVADGDVSFTDRVLGVRSESVAESVGDFVVRRRDGVLAYQLAVVVDDLAMEIDDVVRGADLVDSTARQIQLIEALGGSRPAYAHVPLVLNAVGEKLSKRDAATALRSLRQAGIAAETVCGYLAFSLGLRDRPVATRAVELVSEFSWEALSRSPLVLPADVVGLLSKL
jgi:glutamyl-tRNA synthetase